MKLNLHVSGGLIGASSPLGENPEVRGGVLQE